MTLDQKTGTLDQNTGHASDAGYGAPTGIYGPVSDWATDLDHADPAYNPRAHEIWDELRTSGCPVAHRGRMAGTP